MSRSYRKTPKGKGLTYNSRFSEKDEKRELNRNTRRINKQRMRQVDVEDIDDLEFETGMYFLGWDPWDDVGYKYYFGDYASCRQQTRERYYLDDYDLYRIETEEHIEIAKEQFKLTDDELKEMTNSVRHGYGYYLRRNCKYRLDKSHDEIISDRQEEYKRYMRK